MGNKDGMMYSCDLHLEAEDSKPGFLLAGTTDPSQTYMPQSVLPVSS